MSRNPVTTGGGATITGEAVEDEANKMLMGGPEVGGLGGATIGELDKFSVMIRIRSFAVFGFR